MVGKLQAIVPASERPNKKVIALLREYLARARRGEIRAVSLVARMAGDTATMSMADAGFTSLLEETALIEQKAFALRMEMHERMRDVDDLVDMDDEENQ